MKIISGGQTGVDRAALDVAIKLGIEWGGWCPKGGWAEDFPAPPGVLAKYPGLKETPSSHPLQRTEWNIRDSNATLILTDSSGLASSIGTTRAHELAHKAGKPMCVLDVTDPQAHARGAAWLDKQRKRFGADLILGIGGPRETEAPGIHARAEEVIEALLAGA